MGAKLREYYALAGRRGGLPLQIKLAMRTGISQPKAVEVPDSYENVRIFEKAMTELLEPARPKFRR